MPSTTTCVSPFTHEKSGRFNKGDDGGKDDNQGGEAGHLPTDSGQKVHILLLCMFLS